MRSRSKSKPRGGADGLDKNRSDVNEEDKEDDSDIDELQTISDDESDSSLDEGQEIDSIYIGLETIRTIASTELVKAIRDPGPKQQQQSSKRRRASTNSTDKVPKRQTKRSKPDVDIWSLFDDFRNAEQLTNADFVTKADQLRNIFNREWDLRDRYPDHSLDRAEKEYEKFRPNWYLAHRPYRTLTDRQFREFYSFWDGEIERLIKLRGGLRII